MNGGEIIMLITKKDIMCAIYWILVSLMLICEVFYYILGVELKLI